MIDSSSAASLLVSGSKNNANNAAGMARVAMLGKPKVMTEAQMDVVAQDFEAMFVAQMLGQMFSDSMSGSYFGDENTREVYKTMMMDEYGKKIAQTGGIGIASYVKRELLALQEASI